MADNAHGPKWWGKTGPAAAWLKIDDARAEAAWLKNDSERTKSNDKTQQQR